MREHERGSPARETQGLGILLGEIWCLALEGGFDEALRLVAEARCLALEPEAAAEVDLLAARILIQRGVRGDRAEGVAALRRLSDQGGLHAWRAQLELTRLMQGDGKPKEAVALLKQTLDRFRTSSAPCDPFARLMAEILTAEAERLHRASIHPPRPRGGDNGGHDTALDPAWLLRLIDLGRRMASETDPESVLRIILHEAIDLAGAERGFIVLLKGDLLDFALAENLDWSEVHEPAFEVSRSLIREVAVSGRSAYLSLADLPDHDPMSESLAERGIHVVSCVPIVGAKRTLGVLYLDRRRASESSGGKTRRLLDLFAGQAAAALENTRAHERRVLELEAARELIRLHQSESGSCARYERLTGSSEPMLEVYKRLDLIIPSEMTVVIRGETGTGKELVARLIHDRGPRSRGPFVALNCAGLAEGLLESELFGHEKGAFTGADRARPGLIESAHRGTLFLDEVGDMSPRMQAELLRALQFGETRRVGGRRVLNVDIRVIAATHRDLEEKVRKGEFREDLFYRLNVLTLSLPALRERHEDIPLLAAEILRGLANGADPPAVSEAAMRQLMAYSWPGNIRQLENVVRRLYILGLPVVEAEHLPKEIRVVGPEASRPGTLRTAEEEAVRRAIEFAGGNRAEAARILGVDPKTLRARLRRMSAS